MAGPDHGSATVANIHIEVTDNPVEGSYPTPRTQWPTAAHAPAILGFVEALSYSFKFLSEDMQREHLVKMAIALTALGKGATVKDVGTIKDRSIAYMDAVMMGERASRRVAMLGDTTAASSCGMFVRSLYKMIGVKDPRYDAEYVWGTVMATEIDIAQKVGALVTPGSEEQVMGADGNLVTQLRMPKKGDAVYIRKGASQHVQVITDVVTQTFVKRTDKKGKVRQYPNYYYAIAQGGQAAVPDKFPDDGSCMATNQSHMHLDSQNWLVGSRKVDPGWIDLYKLSDACDDGPIIMPVRKTTW